MRLTQAIKIVHIVFNETIRMNQVSENGLVAQGSSIIVNLIRGINKITARQSHLFPLLYWGTLGVALRRLELVRETRKRTRVLTDRWRSRGEVIVSLPLPRILAGPVAEVCSLVHVDPETVDVNANVAMEEYIEFVGPEVAGARVEEIGVHGDTGPNSACLCIRTIQM